MRADNVARQGSAPGAPLRRALWRLGRVPLLHKILGANAAIVTLGAVAGTAIALRHGAQHPGAPHLGLTAEFAAAGVVLSVVVNYLVLRLVLRPLGNLQRAVDAVRTGAAGVRVAQTGLTDEQLEHLTETFNQMLAMLEETTQRLRAFPAQVLRAQEDERRRIARELHDEAAQLLTSLLVRLRLLEQTKTPEDARTRVAELRDLTLRALQDVRRIAVELRPAVLDDLGLAAAVQAQVDELNERPGLRATLVTQGLDGRLPSDLELVFYRVAQEALTNAVRHARASSVRVRLARADGRVALAVEDDGVGFDSRGPAARSGLGLEGMRERVTLIGGEIHIESAPGGGTKVVASAPLPSTGDAPRPSRARGGAIAA